MYIFQSTSINQTHSHKLNSSWILMSNSNELRMCPINKENVKGYNFTFLFVNTLLCFEGNIEYFTHKCNIDK